MKALYVRYLNEIVGLTIMALMTLALVAGQADAHLQKAAVDEVRDVIDLKKKTITPTEASSDDRVSKVTNIARDKLI